MEEKILMPKRLNLDNMSFKFLADVQNKVINSTSERIYLDFSECIYTDASFTAFIGALTEIGNALKKEIVLCTMRNSDVCKYFKKSGLYGYVTRENIQYINDNAIPFIKATLDEEFIIDYIDKILELAPIKLSGDCRSQLFRNIYEIFSNSIDHAEARYGVYSCGHWMPNRKELVFSIYDTGNGIVNTVQSKIDDSLVSEEAIKWALKRGNSTKQLTDGTPRGVGLADLCDFIRLNKGSLRIMTNDAYYKYNKSEACVKLETPIIGTLISITIVADYEHVYVLKS